LGATNIILGGVKPTEEKKQNRGDDILTYGLTVRDLDRLTTTVPTLVSATPLREFRKDIRHREHKVEGRVVGVMPNYLALNGLKMNRGRFLTDTDNERYANVAVLGAGTAETLFPLEDP